MAKKPHTNNSEDDSKQENKFFCSIPYGCIVMHPKFQHAFGRKISLVSVMNIYLKNKNFGELMQNIEELFLSLQPENGSSSEFELF